MKPDNPIEPDDDLTDIQEALSVLRHIRSSPAATSRYRMIVDSELALLPAVRVPSVPWWKRSVRVPLPVVVAAGILLILSTWTAQVSRRLNSTAAPEGRSQPPVTNTQDMQRDIEPSRPDSEQKYELALSVSGMYLRGVGPLSTETHYVIKDLGQ